MGQKPSQCGTGRDRQNCVSLDSYSQCEREREAKHEWCEHKREREAKHEWGEHKRERERERGRA